MDTIQVGDIVETSYNSGIYVGEVLQDKRNFLLIKVLAVLKHPTQGDLHKRGQVEGVAFHERKALAFGEKTNARKMHTTLYTGEIPPYAASLKQSVIDIKEELKSENTVFNQLSLERIASLEKDFYEKIYG